MCIAPIAKWQSERNHYGDHLIHKDQVGTPAVLTGVGPQGARQTQLQRHEQSLAFCICNLSPLSCQLPGDTGYAGNNIHIYIYAAERGLS